ncbi:MAG: heat shock protein HspQ [Lentisphaeraceae bacterium]|nr:heat shock protein HspQ [Lentisphaeraceae bacterium]
MSQLKDLPHLLRLIDDDSEEVRRVIISQLTEFGDELESEIDKLHISLNAQQQSCLESILKPAIAEKGNQCIFNIGDMIRHKRYGYRGVIVAADPCCQAEESWYLANRTQPATDQPWYHVLVHNTLGVTYPAQSNLELDTSDQLISHPLLHMYFNSFHNGHYLRNSEPWRQW